MNVITTARKAAGGPGEQHPTEDLLNEVHIYRLMKNLPATNNAMKCTSMIRPHQPPANTFVYQKCAATLPNSVNIRTITAKTSMMPMNIIKHLGHTRRKALLSGDFMFHYKVIIK